MFNILRWFVALCLLLVSGCGLGEVSRLKKEASRGDAKSQRLLGAMYFSGKEIVQDYAESERLYLLAAEQGDFGAQRHLGFCYYSGKGVTQDSEKAVKWLRLIAEQGEAKAQVFLGSCYFLGKGVRKDYPMAYAWCNTSINQLDDTAKRMRNLCMKRMTVKEKEIARRLSAVYEEKFVK